MARPPMRSTAVAPDRRGQFVMRTPAAESGLTTVDEIEAPVVKENWQQDAYSFTEAIGEVGYVLNLKANMLSRCRIRPEVRVPGTDEWVETDDPRVLRVLDAFRPPEGEQGELLRQGALHYEIAGEAYLTGTPIVDERNRPAGLLWEFLSTLELKVEKGGRVTRNPWGGSQGKGEVESDAYVARLHHRDPRYSQRADCPMRRVLPICRELVLLTQVIDAIAKSRLSAGLLYVPWEVSFGPDNEWENPGNPESGADEFEEELARHINSPIEDRTAASSLVPLLMRGPAFIKDKPAKELIGLIDLTRQLDGLYKELREEALGRLASGLDINPEVMTGKANLNHWCVSDDTEVLTRDRGWVLHGDLHIGDFIRTLNHSSGVAEWGPVLDIYRADVAGEPMVLIEGARHSSLTTPNHRWPSVRGRRGERTWTTSEALDGSDSLVVAAPSGDVPVEAKWSDALVEVAAWLWTEGHVRFRPGRRSPQVTIWQSAKVNADNVARIRSALTVLFGASGPHGHGSAVNPVPGWHEAIRPDRPEMVEFRLNSAAADVVVGLFSDPARKVLDLGFIRDLTAAQLALFIDTSVRADGTVLPSGTIQLAQADADRLAPLELAAVLSGFSTNVYGIPGGMTMLSISRKTLFPLTRKRVEETVYTGTVWCPVTPNRTWLARRNGKAFYTGNTGYNVDADFIAKHIVPLGDVLVGFSTSAYLRPMLTIFEGMDPEEAKWFRFALDVSPITAETDLSDNATTGFQFEIVSGEAWVRHNGLDEADMPSEEERLRRTLERLLYAQPTLGPAILPVLYPENDALKKALAEWEVGPSVPGGAQVSPFPAVTGPPPRSGGKPPSDVPRLADIDRTTLQVVLAAADRDLDRALERAANRLISRCNGIDRPAAERLRSARRVEVLTLAGPELAMRAGLGREELFSGCWDDLSARVAEWLRVALEKLGAEPYAADRRAQAAAAELAQQLSLLAITALDRAIPVGPNGFKVPDELVLSALVAGDLQRS